MTAPTISMVVALCSLTTPHPDALLAANPSAPVRLVDAAGSANPATASASDQPLNIPEKTSDQETDAPSEITQQETVPPEVNRERRGALEWSLLVGLGSGTVTDPPRTSTEITQLVVGVAFHFPTETNPWGNKFGIALELIPLFTIDQAPSARGYGVNLMARFRFGSVWQPMLHFGAGMLATNEEVPPGESQLNFTPQIGAALQRRLGHRVAMRIEYRYHHLSNAGLTERNPGINSHLALVGLAWYP